MTGRQCARSWSSTSVPTYSRRTGGCDRGSLARKVAGSRGGLRWLEELTHPLVAAEVKRRADQAPDGAVVVTEVPLLFEARYTPLFDLVVTVEAPRDVRSRRAAKRAVSHSFDELDGLQATPEQRMSISDRVFVNDGDISHLRSFVRGAYERARDAAGGGACRGSRRGRDRAPCRA